MLFLLLLLAQDAPPSPSPAPAGPRPKIAQSTNKQRDSVKRQTNSLGLSHDGEPSGFFTTPWPRQDPPAAPAAPSAPTINPASFSTSRAMPWACEPMQEVDLARVVDQAAARQQLPSKLLRAVIRQESAGFPCAVSPKGAAGLMQLMPSTARQLSVSDPFNPVQNVEGGARLLRQLIERYPGDLGKALAAYNAGTVPVDQHGGVPPYAETRNYVERILGFLGTQPPIEQ